MGIFRRRANAETADHADDFVLEAEVEVVFAIRAAGKGDLYWGAPTRCPVCGVYGFVEEVDHAKGATRNRCLTRDCGGEWVVTRRALREMRRRVTDGSAPRLDRRPGDGVAGAVPIPEASPLSSHEEEGWAPESSWAESRAASDVDPLDRFSEPVPPPVPIGIDLGFGSDGSDASQDAAEDAEPRPLRFPRSARDRIA